MNSSQALVSYGHALAPANGNHRDPSQRVAQLEAELALQEPVIGAAILAAAAFRLRDEAGLIDTMRLLAQSVAAFEERQAGADG